MKTKNKRKANALEVDNSCKHYIRKGLQKTETASVLDFEFTNSRLLSIKLAINTNYLVLRVAIWQQRKVTYTFEFKKLQNSLCLKTKKTLSWICERKLRLSSTSNYIYRNYAYWDVNAFPLITSCILRKFKKKLNLMLRLGFHSLFSNLWLSLWLRLNADKSYSIILPSAIIVWTALRGDITSNTWRTMACAVW